MYMMSWYAGSRKVKNTTPYYLLVEYLAVANMVAIREALVLNSKRETLMPLALSRQLLGKAQWQSRRY